MFPIFWRLVGNNWVKQCCLVCLCHFLFGKWAGWLVNRSGLASCRGLYTCYSRDRAGWGDQKLGRSILLMNETLHQFTWWSSHEFQLFHTFSGWGRISSAVWGQLLYTFCRCYDEPNLEKNRVFRGKISISLFVRFFPLKSTFPHRLGRNLMAWGSHAKLVA